MASSDPFADVTQGDPDPIGDFNPEFMCNAHVNTYPGSGNVVNCLRPPHPKDWLHISACDDKVDYVWRELNVREWERLVLTDDGICCRLCGGIYTTSEDKRHYDGCAFDGEGT